MWQGRLLGINRMVTLPNHSVLIGTGNNVRMTSELAKRTVPIILQPESDAPEERTGFVHANISTHVLERRREALACLLGMVELWRRDGTPEGTMRLGGFDAWAKLVGGVMASMGYTDWLANRKRWLRDADPEGNDLTDLISAWLDKYGDDPVPAHKLLELADGRELFQDTISGRDAAQRVASFSRAVLSRHKERPVGGHIVRHKRTQTGGRWFLHACASGVDVQ
jgi:hypothetical protein